MWKLLFKDASQGSLKTSAITVWCGSFCSKMRLRVHLKPGTAGTKRSLARSKEAAGNQDINSIRWYCRNVDCNIQQISEAQAVWLTKFVWRLSAKAREYGEALCALRVEDAPALKNRVKIMTRKSLHCLKLQVISKGTHLFGMLWTLKLKFHTLPLVQHDPTACFFPFRQFQKITPSQPSGLFRMAYQSCQKN